MVAGAVMFNAFHTHVLPPLHAVKVGAATLMGLMVLVPLSPVVTLMVDAMLMALVVEVTAAVVASVMARFTKLPVSVPWA